MRTFFILHENEVQLAKADWIASRFPFTGFIIVRNTRPPVLPTLWKRIRKRGLIQTLDEAAFKVYWRLVRSARDQKQIAIMTEELRHEVLDHYERPPVYYVDDINSKQCETLLKQLNPDVCLLILAPIVRKAIFAIPRLGMFVYHPGVAPEYRGVHTAFWAVANQEPEYAGWTLLKIDAGIDTGPILAQGSLFADGRMEDPAESHDLLQHRAQIEGLPAVVDVLSQLRVGEWPLVSRQGRPSRYYSHPGLSDYIRWKRSLRQSRGRRVQAAYSRG
jgi:methionyl-tRNA formyltransferase